MQLRIKNINQGMKCRCPQSIVHKVEIGHLYRKATKTLLFQEDQILLLQNNEIEKAKFCRFKTNEIIFFASTRFCCFHIP